MELPNIGKQCSQINCKQLDFLPLKCEKCLKEFCTEHFNQHLINNPTCIPNNNSNEVTELKKITNLFKCSFPDCKTTSIIPIQCMNCKQNFCIQHRHINECNPDENPEIKAKKIEKLQAPVREFNQAKLEVDKQIETQLNKAKLNTKKREMANKVQLMKIKAKATGLKTIPINDRIHFNIINRQLNNKPIFVSKLWTIGRVIDSIADECHLTNNNNKLNEKKLRLFHENGGILTKIMSESLVDLLNQEIVFNGENLIIDYVDENCDVISK